MTGQACRSEILIRVVDNADWLSGSTRSSSILLVASEGLRQRVAAGTEQAALIYPQRVFVAAVEVGDELVQELKLNDDLCAVVEGLVDLGG